MFFWFRRFYFPGRRSYSVKKPADSRLVLRRMKGKTVAARTKEKAPALKPELFKHISRI
jgi:hypothetical protein